MMDFWDICFASLCGICAVILLGYVIGIVYVLFDHYINVDNVRVVPVNLPGEEASSFPVKIFSDRTRVAGSEAKCSICSSEFKSGDELTVLPRCNHGFHVKCMEGLASQSSCPVCGTKCRMLPENLPELDV